MLQTMLSALHPQSPRSSRKNTQCRSTFERAGHTQELIKMINQTQEKNDQFSFLLERILGFLKNLSKETMRLNKPVRDGSPMRRLV